MNNLDKSYQNLLKDILENGKEKKDRTGTGTLSVFGRQIRHDMKEGFPLLTTKKMAWKSVVNELLWFLRGDTNIKFLVDNDCHIWDGDSFSNYQKTTAREIELNSAMETHPHYGLSKEEFINKIKTDGVFAKQWGDLGPIYGKQWRDWGGQISYRHEKRNGEKGVHFRGIDQIENLINDLKKNPDSRRLMVNSWNVGELDSMVLPPCHYGFQVYTRELSTREKLELQNNPTYFNEHGEPTNIPTRAISLLWNQRSVDTFLGLPFNIASYGLLLEIIAKAVNMVPYELIGNLGDVHLYSNHIEQAKEQIGRKYTHEERSEMLKEAMGYEKYHNAVSDLMPFGGGMSEYYDIHKIPTHTRQPYPLPSLNLSKTNEFWNEFDVSLFGHLDSTDFIIENYQSHSTIKAPLSN